MLQKSNTIEKKTLKISKNVSKTTNNNTLQPFIYESKRKGEYYG